MGWLADLKAEENITYYSGWDIISDSQLKGLLASYRDAYPDDPTAERFKENLKIGDWDE